MNKTVLVVTVQDKMLATTRTTDTNKVIKSRPLNNDINEKLFPISLPFCFIYINAFTIFSGIAFGRA